MNPRQILRVFTVMILAMAIRGNASPISLSGTIYDKDNKPMAGVVVSLALAGLADTTGADGKWTVAGAQGIRIFPRGVQPMAKWSGKNLHIDLTAPALVQMDAFDVRGVRLGRVAQLMVDAGSHEIPVASSVSARGAHWLLLTVDGKRQVLATGGRVKIAQQPLPGALGRAMADSVEQIIYTLQGQLISADTVRNLIQSGLEKWVQEFSVSGNVLSDPRVTVDSVFAWFDGGRMTGMRRARLGYNKANLAYSGRLYTVKSFTDVFNFRVWLNVMGNGNRKTGISDTTDFSSDFGDINYIPKFNIANAIPTGTIDGPVTGLVNTTLTFILHPSRTDIPIAHLEWDVGNGSGFQTGKDTIQAKWLTPGSYSARVQVTSIDSNTVILTKTVNISNQLALVIGVADTTITPNDVIAFRLTAHDTDSIAKIIWNFGDSTEDSTFTGEVSHRYPGTNTIPAGTSKVNVLTATVVDKLGNKTQQRANITVSNDMPTVIVQDAVGEPDSMIILHATTSDRGTIVRYEWSVNGSAFANGGKDTAITLPAAVTTKYPILVRVTDEDANISVVDSSNIEITHMVRDERDGRIYRTITIGSQTWMADNLIWKPDSPSDSSWCLINDSTSCFEYGRLYNWSSANAVNQSYGISLLSDPTVRRGACPEGWHLPDSTEFETLVENAGGKDSAYNNLRSTSLELWPGWPAGSYGITNPSGFNAIVTGIRQSDGGFSIVRYCCADYWTRNELNSRTSGTFTIDGSKNSLYINYPREKSFGFSIRCIKDL